MFNTALVVAIGTHSEFARLRIQCRCVQTNGREVIPFDGLLYHGRICRYWLEHIDAESSCGRGQCVVSDVAANIQQCAVRVLPQGADHVFHHRALPDAFRVNIPADNFVVFWIVQTHVPIQAHQVCHFPYALQSEHFSNYSVKN